MSWIKKLAASVLAAATVLALGACNTSNTRVAMTVGKTEIPAGVYIYYLNTAMGEVSEKAEGTEFENNIWGQTIDGVSAKEWAEDRAVDYCLQLIAVEREFSRRGLSFTATEQSNLDSNLSYYWSYLGESMEEAGISQSSYERVQKQGLMGQKILLDIYGEGGEQEIPEQELKDYMSENYMRLNHILISNKDDDGNTLTDDALTEAENKANELLNQMKEASEEDFIKTLKEESADYNEERDTDEVLKEGMISPIEDSGYVEEFETAAKALKAGEVGLAESEYGWHIIKRYAMWDDGVVDLEDYRTEVIIDMKGEDYEAELENWGDALRSELTLNEKAVERYDVTKM